jgi:predicted adenylyl cyclase CyaB
MLNIEIKARLHDRRNVETRLEALGARRLWTHRQQDTFFAVPTGWLKLREVEGRPAEVISYRRPTSHAGPRASDFDVILVEDGAAWMRLLARVLAVDKVVAKERTLWIYEHTRIHLDRVDSLGEFLELETVVEEITQEAARAETQRLVATLGIQERDLVAVPYRDLLS